MVVLTTFQLLSRGRRTAHRLQVWKVESTHVVNEGGPSQFVIIVLTSVVPCVTAILIYQRFLLVFR